MSAEAKKGYGSTIALLLLGLLVFEAGSRWLPLLIPAALLVWYVAAGSAFRRSRG